MKIEQNLSCTIIVLRAIIAFRHLGFALRETTG